MSMKMAGWGQNLISSLREREIICTHYDYKVFVAFDKKSHKNSMDTNLMERQHEYVGTNDQIWRVGFYFIMKVYHRLKPSILTC